MGGLLLRMMGCAGYGGEVINSDFYGKRSKFERRNIKKHRGGEPGAFLWGCGAAQRRWSAGGWGAAAQRGISVSGL